MRVPITAGIMEINLSEYKTLNESLAGLVSTGYVKGDATEAMSLLGAMCYHMTAKTLCQGETGLSVGCNS